MEPTIIATAVMTVLTQLFKKGMDKFAEEAGSTVFEKTKNLFVRIKQKWHGDASAGTILTEFEKQPDEFKSTVQAILEKQITNDREFADELHTAIESIKQAGPQIKIVQDIEVAEKKVTLFDVGNVKKGNIEGEQRIKEAKDDVVGFKAKSLGDE